MNILVATTNFGLGPVSKLYSILQEILKMKDISVTFLGNGLSLDFIKRNFGNKITYKICDTDNINETELLEIADFEKYNLFINVMNINIPKIQKSKKIKIKSVFVDSLSWIWNNPLNDVENYSIYFVQNTFINKNKLPSFSNLKIINPIVNTENIQRDKEVIKNTILINFAGITTPYKNDFFYKDYIKFYLGLFSEMEELLCYRKVYACNKAQLQWLRYNDFFGFGRLQ